MLDWDEKLLKPRVVDAELTTMFLHTCQPLDFQIHKTSAGRRRGRKLLSRLVICGSHIAPMFMQSNVNLNVGLSTLRMFMYHIDVVQNPNFSPLLDGTKHGNFDMFDFKHTWTYYFRGFKRAIVLRSHWDQDIDVQQVWLLDYVGCGNLSQRKFQQNPQDLRLDG